MMYSAFFIFLCIVLSSVKSAVFHSDQAEIPGHEGECHDEDAKVFYKKGEIMKNKGTECVERKCIGSLEETGKVGIEMLTCPVIRPGPGFTVVQDLSKPYPQCCFHLVPMPSIEPRRCGTHMKERK